MTFDAFHLDPRLSAGVASCGFTTPTPIQEQAIPPVSAGRDVLGLAQTGTGKTAAYALPIMQHLLEQPRGSVHALVVAPTRELAEQIAGDFRRLGRKARLTVQTLYGGVSINPQIDALRRGVDIVVACPGRLLDHMSQRAIDLSSVQVLVLDEADMMLDMGFLPDVRRILRSLPEQRQNLLFSATMPDDIRRLADTLLHDPVTVQIGIAAPAETVSHALYPVPRHLKTPLLLELLKRTDTDSVLIFTRTKHRAKKLGTKLAQEGYSAASLQGNLSQRARQAALDGFRDGTYKILVATDIAARGIDVSQISHVINYDIPDTTDAYTHRIGRTGRARRTGDAFTLITDEDTVLVRDIEKVLGTPIERRVLAGFDYKAPAPQRDTEFAWDPRPARRESVHSRTAVRPSTPAAPSQHRENTVKPQDRAYRESRTTRRRSRETS